MLSPIFQNKFLRKPTVLTGWNDHWNDGQSISPAKFIWTEDFRETLPSGNIYIYQSYFYKINSDDTIFSFSNSNNKLLIEQTFFVSCSTNSDAPLSIECQFILYQICVFQCSGPIVFCDISCSKNYRSSMQYCTIASCTGSRSPINQGNGLIDYLYLNLTGSICSNQNCLLYCNTPNADQVVIVSYSNFLQNSATKYGLVIQNPCSSQISNSNILNNQGDNLFYNYGEMSLIHCCIKGNSGGTIFASLATGSTSGSISLNECSIDSNQLVASGSFFNNNPGNFGSNELVFFNTGSCIPIPDAMTPEFLDLSTV